MTQTLSSQTPQLTHKNQSLKAFAIVGAAAVAWLILYNVIQPFANWLAYGLLALPQDSHLGESLAFFFYDVPKIILLLGGMIFLISLLRTFFSAEQTRAWLGGKREGVGNVLAAMLGIVTPFCSCSAVPLFIGFVESGIPLGVTFSFLIAAPTINEVAVVMLFGLFGWKVAGLYIASGLIISIIAGVVIGRLKMERYVEDFVWQMQSQGGGLVEKLTCRSASNVRGPRSRKSSARSGCTWWSASPSGRAFTAMCRMRPGRDHGQTGLVVGAGGGSAGHPALLQRGRRHPHRQRVDGKGRFARHGAGLHDVGGGTEPAGDDHPAARAQAAVDRRFHRHGGAGHHHHRLFVQPGAVIEKLKGV